MARVQGQFPWTRVGLYRTNQIGYHFHGYVPLNRERQNNINNLQEEAGSVFIHPPHTAHPPGVLTGLLMGNTLWIHQLCTNENDIATKLEVFFDRLLYDVHQHKTLLPIFLKTIENARFYSLNSDDDTVAIKEAKQKAAERSVYLHVPFHPNNPSSSTIQSLRRVHVAAPTGELPLNMMQHDAGAEIPMDQLTIAFHRALIQKDCPPNWVQCFILH